MANNVAELLLRFKGDSSDLKSTMAQVRSELAQTDRSTKTVNQSQLSMRQQLASVSSLQRQRSAALISEWKKAETAAASLARGVKPVGDNLQRITDVMQTLGGSSAALQGPLGGVAGRLRSIGSLATEAGGGLGVAGVAAGALLVVVAGLSKAVFDITKATAEWQGKLFDLSQQTGVSVETLSALEIQATTTGGSIEGVTASLGIFQKNLEDAQDPTSKEAKLLKDLGIEAGNTEQALRQTLTRLAAMPEGFQQTSAALELFGRGGKSMLAILKEMDGDLDGAMKKFREMGILVSTDAAKAADEFNDRLAVLGFQIRSVTAIIGNEAMPTISEAISSLSTLLTENRETIKGWVDDLSDVAKGASIVASALWEINKAVSGLDALKVPLVLKVLLAISAPGLVALKELGALTRGPFDDVTAGIGNASAQGGRVPRSGTGGKGKNSRDEILSSGLKNAALAEKETLQAIAANVEENKRALEEEARDIEDFTARAIALSTERKNATIDNANAELLLITQALKRKSIIQSEFDTKYREQNIEVQDARLKHSEEVFNLEQERDKKLASAQIAAKRRELEIAEDADQRTIDRIKARIDRGVLLESEGEAEIGRIIDEGFERRKKALEDEDTLYGLGLERRKDITNELIRLEGERAGAAEDAARRILKAQFDEQNRGFGDATRPRRAIDPILDAGPFRTLSEELSKAGILSQQTAAIVGDTLAGAFGDLANAVGQAVHSFVLFGKVEGGFRKFAAELIASLAASAAVQAVYQLAQGIAWSALFAFFPNPKYAEAAGMAFASAAVFGSIAGVATVAGRALAGNSFNRPSGGGGSGSTFNPSGNQDNQTPRTIERDRNYQPPNVTIVMHGEAATAFNYKVVNAVIDDHRSNGRIRAMVVRDET
jgi:hypothetical protein